LVGYSIFLLYFAKAFGLQALSFEDWVLFEALKEYVLRLLLAIKEPIVVLIILFFQLSQLSQLLVLAVSESSNF
jgi:hypothetical protein